MGSLYLIVLACLTWLLSIVQGDLQANQVCYYACLQTFTNITFSTFQETDDYYTGYCEDDLRLLSTFLCSTTYCTAKETASGLAFVADLCTTYTGVDIPTYGMLEANASHVSLNSLPVLQMGPINETLIVDTLLLPSQGLFYDSYQLLKIFQHEEKLLWIYGWSMIGFWAVVLLLGTFNRLLHLIVRWKWPATEYQAKHRQDLSGSQRLLYRIAAAFRRFIAVPALIGYRHQQPLVWCTIPARLQSLLIFIFVIYNLLVCAIGYKIYFPDIYGGTSALQLFGYIANRTGVMACANLPLVWLFAGRNDVFLWLTGWSFATFTAFHRWVARIVTIQAIVHSIGHTCTVYWYGGGTELAIDYKERYFWCGAISTISMSFLLIFSVLPLRQKLYELFLYLHRSLALVALVTLFYHLEETGDEYKAFIWPCVALWAFDYAIRWVRLLVLNYKVAVGGHVHAVISYDNDHDVIQLTVFPSFHLAPNAGTHYFLYFPTLLRSFGAHPFTISGWTTPQGHSEPMQVDLGSEEKGIEEPQPRAEKADVANDIISTSDVESELRGDAVGLKFLIRPQKGLTAFLRDRIIKMDSRSSRIPVLLEGPYGMTYPLEDYDTVLFIVGGTGISPVFGYLQSMLNQPRKRYTAQIIRVAWVGRSPSFFSYAFENGLRTALADANITIELYLTGERTFDGVISKSRNQNVKTYRGRPRPSELIKSVVQDDAQPKTGSVAVFVCGPGTLADDARQAVTGMLGGDHSVRLDYFEERFGW